MPARFQPFCRAMLRGGLPHRESAAAIAQILRMTPDIAGWPLLPALSPNEQTAVHASVGLPGVTLDRERERLTVDRTELAAAADALALAYLRDDVQRAELPESHAAGLYGLLRTLNNSNRQPYAVKGQVIGPISLSLLLTDSDERPLADDATCREALLQLTSLRVNWQAQLMQGYAEHQLILVEEPFLHALSHPLSPLDWDDADEQLSRLFDDRPALIGLGTRGDCAWEMVLRWPIDLLCFEYMNGNSTLLRCAEPLAAYLTRGGLLGWGIVPSSSEELTGFDAEQSADELARTMQRLAIRLGLDEAFVRHQSLVTTAGGLGMLAPDTAERALAACAVISRHLTDQPATA